MAYDLSEFKKHSEDTIEWLKKEYRGIRAGRATPTVLDGVKINMYGSKLPLNQVASVSVEDPKTLRVVSWDTSQIKIIRKAIEDADIGVSVSDDEKGLRVSFPDLSSERREQLLKIAKDRLEEARVALRNKRDEIWSDIQSKTKEGELSEDEKFKYKEELQKLIDSTNKNLDELLKKKEEEIKS